MVFYLFAHCVCKGLYEMLGPPGADAVMHFEVQGVYWGSLPVKGKGRKQDWTKGETEP